MKTPTNKKMLKIKHLCCVIAAVLFSFGAYADQTAWYVKADGSASADGSSWDNATTLAHAFQIVTAGSATGMHEIVLKSGTAESPAVYDVTVLAQNGQGGSAFTLPGGYIRIRGEADDPAATVVKSGYDTYTNRFVSVAGDGTEFSSLTFKEFYTTNSGGVIYAGLKGGYTGYSTLVTNCVFEHNFALKVGGALYFYSSDEKQGVFDCTFISNRCVNFNGGSAICRGRAYGCSFIGQSGGSVMFYCQLITNCLFRANHTTCVNVGRAVDCEFRDNDRSENVYDLVATTIYTRNSGAYGGFTGMGIYNSRIIGNTSAGTLVICDGVYDSYIEDNYGGLEKLTRCTVTRHRPGKPICGYGADCVFTNNYASVMASGTLKNCYVVGNCPTNSILVDCGQGNVITVDNCLIISNVCASVVDINTSYNGTKSHVDNTTIADNTCTYGAFNACWFNYFLVRNSIIHGNTPYDLNRGTRTGDAYLGNYYSNCVFKTANYNVTGVTFTNRFYNCIQVDDVKFNYTPYETHLYGYSLKSRSPAIDSGCLYNTTTNDLSGLARLIGAAADMGCYEYEPNLGFSIIIR